MINTDISLGCFLIEKIFMNEALINIKEFIKKKEEGFNENVIKMQEVSINKELFQDLDEYQEQILEKSLQNTSSNQDCDKSYRSNENSGVKEDTNNMFLKEQLTYELIGEDNLLEMDNMDHLDNIDFDQIDK